nr:hypothetical protein CFP56_55875 [Quercus suber]
MAAAALPACFSPNQTHFLSGSLKPTDRCLLNISTCDPSLTPGFQRKAKLTTSKTPFTVRAGTHKILTEKIAQLNSAIDDVSAQLRGDDAPNGATVNSDEVGASM